MIVSDVGRDGSRRYGDDGSGSSTRSTDDGDGSDSGGNSGSGAIIFTWCDVFIALS